MPDRLRGIEHGLLRPTFSEGIRKVHELDEEGSILPRFNRGGISNTHGNLRAHPRSMARHGFLYRVVARKNPHLCKDWLY